MSLVLGESDSEGNKTRSVLLVGPKNSGKTTFSLEIAKEVLDKSSGSDSQVYILDCDLGQPLISPARCVKLVKWDVGETHVGSPRNINIMPEVMFYVGGNSPIDYPLRYLSGLEHCFEYVRSLEGESVTLILNLPGWVTGVGLEITSAIAALCIGVSDSVYIGFTREFGRSAAGSESGERPSRDSFLSFPCFDLRQAANSGRREVFVSNGRRTRVYADTLSDLHSGRQTGEFRKNASPLRFFDEYMGYHSVGGYTFRYSCKTVHFPFASICVVPCPNTTLVSEQLKYHIPFRLTNSVVALCIFDDRRHESIPDFSEDGRKLSILDTKIVLPCVGFGIVHHVDYLSGLVVVTAPSWIPSAALSEVNALQLTEMMLPQSCSSTSKPYICKKRFVVRGIASGGKVPSNRKNVKRKIHNL